MSDPERKLIMFKGYWHIETPKGPRAWHRIVYINHHGKIPDGWVIHHLDADKLNNKIENLIALPESMHNTIHCLKPLPDRQVLEGFVELYLRGHRPDRKALKAQRLREDKKELRRLKAKLNRHSRPFRRNRAKLSASKEDLKDVKIKRYTYRPPKQEWNGRS